MQRLPYCAPGLSRLTTTLHLRHTISRAKPFRAVWSLSRQAETSDNSGFGPSIIYEVSSQCLRIPSQMCSSRVDTRHVQDHKRLCTANAAALCCQNASPSALQDALLVIGSELLDLHLASDAASDVEDAETAATAPSIGVGSALSSSTSFPGPAGLRLAKVHADCAVKTVAVSLLSLNSLPCSYVDLWFPGPAPPLPWCFCLQCAARSVQLAVCSSHHATGALSQSCNPYVLQGRELRSRAAEHAEVAGDMGGQLHLHLKPFLS